MIGMLIGIFSRIAGWSVLQGGISSLFVGFAGYKFYNGAVGYLGYFSTQLNEDYPLLSNGLLVSTLIMGVFIIYRLLSKVFGFRSNSLIDRLLRFSFPLVFLFLVTYLAFGFFRKNADPLNSSLGSLKSEEVYLFEKNRIGYSHSEQQKNDRDYWLKAVRNGYSRFIYDDIIKEIPSTALNRIDSHGKNALLYAVLDGNEEALDAMLACSSVNLNQQFSSDVLASIIPYKVGRGVGQGLWDWLYGTTTLAKDHQFSVAKIAYLKGKKAQARKIKTEGERRGWMSGWREEYYYRVEGDPSLIPIK